MFSSIDELNRLSEDWKKRQRIPVFDRMLGALDGILIACKCPSLREAKNPVKYFCRKGYYGVNMQAVCDAHCRFLWFAVDTPALSHDATVSAS